MKIKKIVLNVVLILLIIIISMIFVITLLDIKKNKEITTSSSKAPNDYPSTNLKSVFLNLEQGLDYDEEDISNACTYIDNRWDCSDFRAISLLRFMYCEDYQLSEESRLNIKNTLINFKYWLSDGGADSMCYWSENHQILFAASEYLAGQMFQNQIFTQTQMTGKEHMNRAEKRILIWLNQRWNYGFSEWHSNIYYVEDIAALANLIEFSQNKEIVDKCKIVMDLIFYDIASQSYYGNFTATSGRAYEKNRKSGEGNSLRGVIDSIWNYDVNKDNRLGLEMNFLSMKNYEVPKVLYSIGLEHTDTVIKASSGVRLSELEELGFTGVNDETIMMQWGMEAFTNKEAILNTLDIINSYDMLTNEAFSDFADINLSIINKSPFLPKLIDLVNPQTNGIVMQQSNTYTYKTKYYMLATAMNYFPGNFGDQQHLQSATLSNDICVYNTHPAVEEGRAGLNGNSPTYWTGYGYLPYTVQDKNVAFSIYRLPKKASLFQAPVLQYTYSWFPTYNFDQWKIIDNKAFGLINSTYIALIGKSNLTISGDENNQLIQEGQDSYWITELANTEEYDNLNEFMTEINNREITWNDGLLTYKSPTKLFELEYGKNFSIDTREQETTYDRFDSPYVKAKRGDEEIIFNFEGQSLKLNFSKNIREASEPGIKINYINQNTTL